MKNLYFIDLFGGCGGLSLGLEQSGFTNILFNEINQSAANTYLKNTTERHPAFEHIKDARELLQNNEINKLKKKWKKHNINDIDLLVGGPPCWGYSRIGIRRTFNPEKVDIGTNHLYKIMSKIIEHIRPKIFLFENVTGLLTARWKKNGNKGEIWEDIKKTFNEIDGYSIQPEVVYCYNYGVPQNRPRIFIVGIRDDIEWKDSINKPCFGRLPDIINEPIPSIIDLLGDLVDPNYQENFETSSYPSNAKTDIQKELRTKNGELSMKGSPIFNHEYSKHSQKIIHKFKYMIENDGHLPDEMRTKKFAQKVLPKKWKNGKPNITVTSLPDDYIHYSQPRTLSVREWARLQTFPDNFIFYGPRTTGGRRRAGEPGDMFEKREIPQYTQIGNAVPVLMAKKFGQHFKNILS